MPESHYQKLIIQKIVEETALTKTFYLTFEDGSVPEYKPGQYIVLAFDTVAGEERRSFSISSIHQNELSITVKRVENGAFSRQFIDRYQPGQILYLAGVSGLFVLPEDLLSIKQVFFLAAGSGIVPIFSLMVQLLTYHNDIDIVLIYSNKSQKDTIYFDRLKALESEYSGRLIVDFLFSDSENILNARLNGFLLSEKLGVYKKVHYKESLFFLCGPFEYMDFIEIVLKTEGVPAHHIRHENFNSFKVETFPEPPDKTTHIAHIQFKNELKEVVVKYPESILSAALSQGLQLPYSCRSGQCGSCAAHCTEGQVWLAYNEVLTDADIKKGLVLTCMGHPINGDVTLNYEK